MLLPNAMWTPAAMLKTASGDKNASTSQPQLPRQLKQRTSHARKPVEPLVMATTAIAARLGPKPPKKNSTLDA